MLWAWLGWIACSWAGDDLVRPTAPAIQPGDCPLSFYISKGDRPGPDVLSPEGLAVCSGVILSPGQAAYLLKTEIHRDAIELLHVQDIQILQAELAECSQPVPWHHRPPVARAIGGAVVAALAAGAWTVYQYGKGDQ